MTELKSAACRLSQQVSSLCFSDPVRFVYNPLGYAWESHKQYLRLYGGGHKRIVFVGMNPGPWGMAQTGVPFGEVATVRDWLGIKASVGAPEEVHPKKPVLGFECRRSEVSGRRLWGLMRQRYKTPDIFFRDHFVSNYCPLLFLDREGRNITPDKLPAESRTRLFDSCDRHLQQLIDIMQPDWLVGVGVFAFQRIQAVAASRHADLRILKILHPSPASPAANRGWSEAVSSELQAAGLWSAAGLSEK